MGVVAVNVQITGRVQGVAFRAWTCATAERCGLSGWVRNKPDGSVHALIVGPIGDTNSMIRELWIGPPAAQVTDVQTEQVEVDANITDFRILR